MDRLVDPRPARRAGQRHPLGDGLPLATRVASRRRRRATDPCPSTDAVSECVNLLSSGSTGTPKLIVSARGGDVADNPNPLLPTQRHGSCTSPLYHGNGFDSRPAARSRVPAVVMEKFDAPLAVD